MKMMIRPTSDGLQTLVHRRRSQSCAASVIWETISPKSSPKNPLACSKMLETLALKSFLFDLVLDAAVAAVA